MRFQLLTKCSVSGQLIACSFPQRVRVRWLLSVARGRAATATVATADKLSVSRGRFCRRPICGIHYFQKFSRTAARRYHFRADRKMGGDAICECEVTDFVSPARRKSLQSQSDSLSDWG